MVVEGGESMSEGMVMAGWEDWSSHLCWCCRAAKEAKGEVVSSGDVAFDTGAELTPVVGNVGKSARVGVSNVVLWGGSCCWNNMSGGEFDREFGAVALV